VYRVTCHQEPYRSYFLGGPRLTYTEAEIEALTETRPLAEYRGAPDIGYKMAFCERDTATYLLILVFGLAFALAGRRLPRLPLRLYAIMLLPMAIDGLTQLTGLRESTWLLRTATGGLFGGATAWLLFPELEQALRQAAEEMTRRQEGR